MTKDLETAAAERDRDDPLAAFREEFLSPPAGEVVAYLDGNSLGRPLRVTRQRLVEFVDQVWSARLIRAWDEGWLTDPFRVGDEIGRVALGAAPGQVVVADSTTVMLYKWIRSAVAARTERPQIVLDTGNFPTDRFVVEGIAAEVGLELRWLDADPVSGITVNQVADAVSARTALVVLSQVAFRTGHLADLPGITAAAHAAGAWILWDLSHSVGVVPIGLDAADVDLAVGCTYKYLNGGPGAPAFGYVRSDLQELLRQPIQGWMGAAEPFAMGDRYAPATGIRRFLSGTPPIISMLAMQDMLELVDRAGLTAIRAKSTALTEFAIELSDRLLAPLGVELATPRDPAQRGSHVLLAHPAFQNVTARLWQRGVIPDFRPPDGLRVGLSPLSTSYTEVLAGITAAREVLLEESAKA
jgi:kynureninase